MSLSDALVLCPLLQTKKATPQADARQLLQLAIWCERYSPLVNIYNQNSLWIELTGIAQLFGGEAILADTIRKDFFKIGYTVQLAIADNFGAAFALSHFAFDDQLPPPIISAGQDHASLFCLPSKALRLSPEILSLLRRLGLTTIGQLKNLPRKSLKRRFSSLEQVESVLLRLDQMFGYRDEPLAPLTPPLVFSCRMRFAEALTSKQMLAQALYRLVDEIIKQLEKQKQGARKLTFTLWRSDGSVSHITIGTSSPCRDKLHICKLFEEKLNRIEPGFGIDIIALSVDKNEPHSAQQTSFENSQRAHTTSSPSVLIDRLRNRLGDQKIGYLHILESHIPERAQQSSKAPCSCSCSCSHTLAYDRPFLLLDPPELIQVAARRSDAPPLLFTWRRVKRKVIASSGPERITREWWLELERKPSRLRDYYKVKTDEGGTFWLYRDGLFERDENATSPPQWYMHGFFG